MRRAALFASVLFAAACTSTPTAAGDPAAATSGEPLLRLHLQHLPTQAWELEARCESGVVRRRDGLGDRAEIRLPPGPVLLALRSDGQVFYLPHAVGPVDGQVLVWDLTAR